MAPYFLEKIHSLRDIEALADIRGFGMLARIDLKPQGTPGMSGMEGSKNFLKPVCMLNSPETAHLWLHNQNNPHTRIKAYEFLRIFS